MSLITSENQIVCFPSFVLTVFWCYTSYTVIVVLWKTLIEPGNALAPWWPCPCLKSVSGRRRLEKTMNFLRCLIVIDLVLKYGSDINEGNSLQLLFYFNVMVGIVVSITGMSFFRCVPGFTLKFSRIALWRKRMQLDSQSDLTTNGLILGFLLGNGFFRRLFFVWTEICKNRWIVALFWGHQIFSMFSSRGILVCSSKMIVFFRHMILWYRLTSCRTAMQLYTLSRFVVEPIFLGGSDKCLWLLLKTK